MPLVTLQQLQGKYLVLASDRNWLLCDLEDHHYETHWLDIDTRAQAIGGFTPLSRGKPMFYTANGARVTPGPLAPEFLPIPLIAALPEVVQGR